MRITPAFMILEEFDSATESGNTFAWEMLGEGQRPPAKSAKILTEADLEQARNEGHEAGYQAATMQFEVILSQRDEEMRSHLAAAEVQFAAQCGARLADDLTQAVREIREELAREAAQSVLPFIDAGLRAMAVDDLAESVMAMSRDGALGTLHVKGPAALIGALQERLPEGWQFIATTDESDPELSVQADARQFRTQIAHWLKRVQEAST